MADNGNAECSGQYSNINLTCVSGEADDNTENNLLENCIVQDYDLVIVQSNNNAAQAPYVKNLVDAGIPVITTNPTIHQSDLDGGDDNSVLEGTGTVDADPIEQAAVGARRAVEEVPENANVVVLRGPSGNYMQSRGGQPGMNTSSAREMMLRFCMRTMRTGTVTKL